jgi:hypothetical protein
MLEKHFVSSHSADSGCVMYTVSLFCYAILMVVLSLDTKIHVTIKQENYQVYPPMTLKRVEEVAPPKVSKNTE